MQGKFLILKGDRFIKKFRIKMRVKLEPETAFIGKKFAYIFLGIIFVLNSIVFIWYLFFSNLTLS